MPAEPAPRGTAGAEALSVREVPLEVVVPLRHAVLRAGRPLASATSRNDADPSIRHLAAFAGSELVGVVSQFVEPSRLAPGQRAEHFRGMAVTPTWHGRGVGRALMRAARDLARSRGAEVLWANGRDTALGFYESVGFRVAPDGFVDDVMHLGHHVVIARLDELRLGPG